MSKTKLVNNNRRVHATKVLAQSSKKNKPFDEFQDLTHGEEGGAIGSQYRIIRGDILRLRKDLMHGYDLVREWFETKVSRRMLIKTK